MAEVFSDYSEPLTKKRKVSDVENDRSHSLTIGDSQKLSTTIKDLELIKSETEPHILFSFKSTTTFPNVTERYLTPYYYINEDVPGNDTCIWVHSNRICLIGLAPSHEIIEQKKKVKCISFKVSDKLDRSSNKVSGKSKHGAQPLQPSSTICTIQCEDEKVYSVKCNMTGKLMEVNDVLLEKPELLFQPPHRGGYLAIALPNMVRFEALTKELLTQELYHTRMAVKKPSINNITTDNE